MYRYDNCCAQWRCHKGSSVEKLIVCGFQVMMGFRGKHQHLKLNLEIQATNLKILKMK